ncbi:MAG: hypothetical protein HXY20_11410 [Acidobacteria bacterium]|nr:hypothetical protein [Acidobacteriota bacterium]
MPLTPLRKIPAGVVAVLLTAAALLFGAPPQHPPGKNPFGEGPGYWPLDGAIYEVNLEYFPNHSLKELTAAMPRLQKLGIRVIYMTPVFQCFGTAQYLIINHFEINPRYGTPEDLKTLVETAHRHGVRLLLDLVTSLTYDGTDIFKNHPDFILRGKDGSMQRYYPFAVWGWALDCANPNVIEYFSKLARHYIEKYGTDGWRKDSPLNNYDPEKVDGDHSLIKIMRAIKTAITTARKDAIMVSECTSPSFLWGPDDNTEEPLFDEMCEASYDFEFCGFLGGNDKDGFGYAVFDGSPVYRPLKPTPMNRVVKNQITSKELAGLVNSRPIRYKRLRVYFIENHDTERVQRAFPRQHRTLFALAASLPGIPVVHAGQEIGSTVHPNNTDSDKKPPIVDWARGDSSLEAFYAKILKIRSGNPAILHGDFKDVWKSGDKAIVFQRTHKENSVLVALNFDDKAVKFTAGIVAGKPGADPGRNYLLTDEITEEETMYEGKALENLALELPPFGHRMIRISERGRATPK